MLYNTSAKQIAQKVKQKLQSFFVYDSVKESLELYAKHQSIKQYLSQQQISTVCPRIVHVPSQQYTVPYSYVFVTDCESTYLALQKHIPIVHKHVPDGMDCIFFIDMDYVCLKDQWFELDALDAFFLKNLLRLSQWSTTLQMLSAYSHPTNIQSIVKELLALSSAVFKGVSSINIESIQVQLQQHIDAQLVCKQIPFSELVQSMQTKILPVQVQTIIEQALNSHEYGYLFEPTYPLTINSAQSTSFSLVSLCAIAQTHVCHAQKLRQVPVLLNQLMDYLYALDFYHGYEQYCSQYQANPISRGPVLRFVDSAHILLDQPTPISYELTPQYTSAIITGANSGGKTTLLEHILTLVVLDELGFNASGQVTLPSYDGVYYFTKQKGSAGSGAFESTLRQLSHIRGTHCLILCDELEAITDPSVASICINQTLHYYQSHTCIIASHLGFFLQQTKPSHVRIDGICAKGLDEQFNVIIDHQPRLSCLAQSTPQLIIQKLAKQTSHEYFSSLLQALPTLP
jgi:hypothetical protein